MVYAQVSDPFTFNSLAMKKLCLIPILFLIASCEDALMENPKSLAVETFYKTPAEVEAAVNAIYNPLRDPNGLGGVYVPMQESHVDYAYGRGSYGILSEFQGLDPTNITRVGLMWDLFYLSIRNANLVIANAPNGSSLTEAQVAQYVGEARFLRALNYFFLVRHWGRAIIRNEENMTVQNVGLSPATDIYNFIEEDLMFAEDNLPDVAKNAGRPSAWTAKAVLADVYFFQNKWPEARDKADEVITSGKYALVPVTEPDDFMAIYGPEVVTTPEEVFYLKFSRVGQNEGWWSVLFFHHPASGMHGTGGYFGQYTDSERNPVYKNWDDNDLRKAYNWYSWNIGEGPNAMLNKKYIDPEATNNLGAGNDFPLYRYADVLLIYAEAASLANNGPTPEAMERLNMVHRRAYGYDPLQPSPVDFDLADYNADSFVDLVLQERGYETQFEGKRWLDLKRTGRVKEIILNTVGKNVADRHLLWPLPVSEMNFNTALDPVQDQNPGY